jgi:hypothetical protein
MPWQAAGGGAMGCFANAIRKIMRSRQLLLLICIAAFGAGSLSWAGEIVFENARFRAVLGDDATWHSLVNKVTGKELLAPGANLALASARVGEVLPVRGAGADANVHDQQAALAKEDVSRSCSANRATFADGILTIGLKGCSTTLSYRVICEPDWIRFTLSGVNGARPVELTLLRLGSSVQENIGTRLGLGWDATNSVGVMGANLQTRGQAIRRKDFAELLATTQDAPGPKVEGASAALIVAPTTEIDAILQRFSAACGLPRNEGDGTPSKRLALARQSYWFMNFGEAEVDLMIDYCNQSGIRQVMLMSSAWCKSPGHYLFNETKYPAGIESLKRTVEKLHAEKILVGMHCFASKVAKIDPYVTPVPDRRFWVDRSATVASDIGAADTDIRTGDDLREWPGSPVAKQKLWEGGVLKHQETIIDDEIITFERIGPEGTWNTFQNCKRGAWGTKPAAHKVATACRHYGVDGCINGYVVDQETALLDETTTRLAEIFNTCGFDMVYFDGGEDVDRRRFDYYVSKFQATAMSKFTKRPLIHMGTIMTHHLWYSFTRSATVDTYMNTLNGHIIAGATIDKWPSVRDHIDHSVEYMLSVRADRMPGELGWFGIWPKGKNTDGLQLDEMEYLMCKSLAYDTPISLETSFTQMAKHPLTPGLLEIVRAYEEFRSKGLIAPALAEQLAEKGKDFALFPWEKEVQFLPVEPVKQIAGGRDLRAVMGAIEGLICICLWHHLGTSGTLLLPLDKAHVHAMDGAGKPIAVGEQDGKVAIPFGPRRVWVLLGPMNGFDAQELLAKAQVGK